MVVLVVEVVEVVGVVEVGEVGVVGVVWVLRTKTSQQQEGIYLLLDHVAGRLVKMEVRIFLRSLLFSTTFEVAALAQYRERQLYLLASAFYQPKAET